MDIVSHIRHSELLSRNDRILAAVSGGPDSVALLHALHRADYNVVVAHCNFHLRGDDSNDDARFVAGLAKNYNLPFCTVDFDTTEVAQQRGVSIEMAARDLRYEWFEKMADEHHCRLIAVAHNANDVVETFFLNLVRGAGINGLSGMAARRGRVVRPLLDVSRNDIMAFIDKNGLQYRVDKTNDETIYRRNKIRHELIPLLSEMNPDFLNTMLTNIAFLKSAAAIVDCFSDTMFGRYACEDSRGVVRFDMQKVRQLAGYGQLVYKWLGGYGFSPSQVLQILSLPEGCERSGKKFCSPTHIAVFNRQILEVYPASMAMTCFDEEYRVDWRNVGIEYPIELKFSIISPSEMKLNGDRQVAYFDAEKLSDTLLLRHWRNGDRMVPFGMSGTKKISDILTQNRLSVVEKQNVWLLESDGVPLWLVGQRADNRYRVTSSTNEVLMVEYSES